MAKGSLTELIEARIRQTENFLGRNNAFLGEHLLEQMKEEFPGNQLALLKAYSYLHVLGRDEEAKKFLEEYEFKKKPIDPRPVLPTLSELYENKEKAEQIESRIAFYRNEIELSQKQIEFCKEQIEFEKRWVPENKRQTKKWNQEIAKCNQEISESNEHIQNPLPLSYAYQAAKEKLEEWEAKHDDITNETELAQRVKEFSEYSMENATLAVAVKSFLDGNPFDLKIICTSAEHTAWYNSGKYGKDGYNLYIFDIKNPENRLRIWGEVYEPFNESFYTRTFVYQNDKEISHEDADSIVKSFAQPCVYPVSDFDRYIHAEEVTVQEPHPLATQLERFLAENDPAYGYSVGVKDGWQDREHAVQSIKNMLLSEDREWIHNALSGLQDERPELSEEIKKLKQDIAFCPAQEDTQDAEQEQPEQKQETAAQTSQTIIMEDELDLDMDM